MNVSGPIKALLVASSTTNSLLSGRVYPVIFPEQYTLPAVAVNITGVNPNPTKSASGDIDTVFVQIDCYASTYSAAQNLSAAVRNVIDYYRGSVQVGVDTYGIDYIDYEGQTDVWEEKPKEWRVSCDYKVRINRQGGVAEIPAFVGMTHDNDGDAINAGIGTGEFYILSSDNDYGMPAGTIKQVILDAAALQSYVSDAAAITGGLNYGDYYKLSAGNIYSLPIGTIKTVE